MILIFQPYSDDAYCMLPWTWAAGELEIPHTVVDVPVTPGGELQSEWMLDLIARRRDTAKLCVVPADAELARLADDLAPTVIIVSGTKVGLPISWDLSLPHAWASKLMASGFGSRFEGETDVAVFSRRSSTPPPYTHGPMANADTPQLWDGRLPNELGVLLPRASAVVSDYLSSQLENSDPAAFPALLSPGMMARLPSRPVVDGELEGVLAMDPDFPGQCRLLGVRDVLQLTGAPADARQPSWAQLLTQPRTLLCRAVLSWVCQVNGLISTPPSSSSPVP